MKNIPLQAVSSQSILIPLGGQGCQINIRQRITGLFLDLLVANEPIVLMQLGMNLRPMVIDQAYLGFVGDIMWVDATGGNAMPVYTGLGTQFALVYLEAADLAVLQGSVPFTGP